MSFPPSVTLVTVHGEILEIDGSPARGTVTFILPNNVRVVGDPALIIPSRYVATLDENGEFTIQLPATDDADLEPVPFAYQVIPRFSTQCDTFYAELPTSDLTVEYADIVPLAAPPTPPSNYVTVATFNASQAVQDADILALQNTVIPDTIIDAKGDLISATAADTPARLAVGTNGQYLRANSATSTGLEWATHDLFARTTVGDQSITNDVILGDITGLGLAVAANSVYKMELFVVYDTGGTPDIQFGLTFPAGATGTWGASPARRAADADADFTAVSIATAINAGGVAAGTVLSASYRGLIITSGTAGTLQVQFCQATTSATATIVKNDSYLYLTKVA